MAPELTLSENSRVRKWGHLGTWDLYQIGCLVRASQMSSFIKLYVCVVFKEKDLWKRVCILAQERLPL